MTRRIRERSSFLGFFLSGRDDLFGGEVGEECGEDGAAGVGTGVASDPDAAAMPGDDVVCDPEPESVAVILLGGEEGVEDFVQRFLRDAGAGVEQGNGCAGALAVAPGPCFPDSDRETAIL